MPRTTDSAATATTATGEAECPRDAECAPENSAPVEVTPTAAPAEDGHADTGLAVLPFPAGAAPSPAADDPQAVDQEPEWRATAHFDYRDSDGKLLFQVEHQARECPGGEQHRRVLRRPHPKEEGRWLYSLRGIQPVPYRIADLADTGRVFVAEDEPCADALAELGLAATCSPFGPGEWPREFAAFVRGRDAVVLARNDSAGRRHAAIVASSLLDAAGSVKVLVPSGIPGGGVRDWLRAGGTVDELTALVDATPAKEPDRRLPVVLPGNGQTVLAAVQEVAAALAVHGEVFIHDGDVVRLAVRESDRTLGFSPLTARAACSELERFCRFIQFRRSSHSLEEIPAVLGTGAAGQILASPELARRLPRIRALADYTMPVRIGDCVRLTCSGYDREAEIWTDPYGPELTPLGSVKDAMAAIFDILQDFCFAESPLPNVPDLYQASALAYLVTAHVRLLFEPERAPIFYAEGNRPGVGKDLVLGLPHVLTTGCDPSYVPPTASSEEIRKLLFSVARDGHRFLIISNWRGHLADGRLEQYATSPRISDRILGVSETRSYANTAIYAISGNSLTYTEDLQRRLLPIALKWYGEQLAERTFRYPDLYGHVRRNRALLLSALQTLVEHWTGKGCPDGRRTLPSFVAWSKVVGGILESCGITNPIGLARTVREPSLGTTDFTALLELWAEDPALKDLVLDVPRIRTIAVRNELFGWLGDLDRDRPAQTRFGQMLRRHERREFSGLRLIAEPGRSRAQYRCGRVEQ